MAGGMLKIRQVPVFGDRIARNVSWTAAVDAAIAARPFALF